MNNSQMSSFFDNGKWIRYKSLYHLLKTSDNYQQLPAQTAQQVLIILDRSWKSFLVRLKSGKNINQDFKGNQNLLDINRRMESFC
jgi:hypothetical protein